MKVLQCFAAETFDFGGQEAFLMNMINNFSIKDISYAFYTPFTITNTKFLKLAKEKNIEVFCDNYNVANKLKSKIGICKGFKKLLKANQFDVIHIHSSWVLGLYLVAKIAKKSGVEKVIVHSHNTGIMNFKTKLYKKISDKNIKKYADKYFACSKLAGEWKFPKDIMESGQCLIINNGIDVNKFKFNQISREKYRKEFGLSDNELVLLNVGRFSEQKNHAFIVEIAKRLKAENIKFKFILVGEGELKSQIQSEIIASELIDNFIFLEKRADVAEIMSASDIFVLPSLYEGLAVTSVESQASGLPTLCSTTITRETQITDLYVPIDLDIELWIAEILRNQKAVANRDEYAEKITQAGFSAKHSAEILEEHYLS